MTRRPPLPEYTYSDLKRPIEVKAYSDPTESEPDQPCLYHGRNLFAAWGQLVCLDCGRPA